MSDLFEKEQAILKKYRDECEIDKIEVQLSDLEKITRGFCLASALVEMYERKVAKKGNN